MNVIENAKKTLRSLSLKTRKIFDNNYDKFENIIFSHRKTHIVEWSKYINCDFIFYYYNKNITNYRYKIHFKMSSNSEIIKHYLTAEDKIWDYTGEVHTSQSHYEKFEEISNDFIKFLKDNNHIFIILNNLICIKYTIEKITRNIITICNDMKYKTKILNTIELALIIAYPWLNFETDVIMNNTDKCLSPITFINRKFKIAAIISNDNIHTKYQRYYLQKCKYIIINVFAREQDAFDLYIIWLKLSDYINIVMYEPKRKISRVYNMIFDTLIRRIYKSQYAIFKYNFDNLDKIKLEFENDKLTPKEVIIYDDLVKERVNWIRILKNKN